MSSLIAKSHNFRLEMSSIDFEVKAFWIASIFAFIKFCGLSRENFYHVLFARVTCFTLHVCMFIILVQTDAVLKKAVSASSRRKDLRTLLGTIAFRLCLVLAIHYKSGFLPPLFVSCAMGSFSLIENSNVYESCLSGLFINIL